MTLKELKAVTKCPIFIERTDTDGAARRTEYLGASRDWQVESLKIVHVEMVGFALAVELAEEGV